MGEDSVSDDFTWDEDTPPSPVSRADRESSTASSAPLEAGSSHRTLFSQFVHMGFSREMVERALKDNEDGDPEKILEALTSNPPAPEASSSGPDLYSHFVRAGYPEKMVERALKDNEHGDPEKILEALTSNPPAPEAGPSEPDPYAPFVRMGFPEKMVDKAIKHNDKGDADGVLETLLAYSVVEGDSSHHEETLVGSSMLSNSPEHWDSDDSDIEEFMEAGPEKDQKLVTLVDMGYPIDEASSAINRCVAESSCSCSDAAPKFIVFLKADLDVNQ